MRDVYEQFLGNARQFIAHPCDFEAIERAKNDPFEGKHYASRGSWPITTPSASPMSAGFWCGDWLLW
jgi:hypothetical protein